MNKDAKEKLKLIDDEISNALNTITELENKLDDIKTDEEGNVLKDEYIVLRDKFDLFNKSLNGLTRMLVDAGILEEEDIQ